MLLPNCSCCPDGTKCCPVSPAPDTLTFKFGKMEAAYIAGPPLITVSLTSCSGSGAVAVALSPEATAGALGTMTVITPGSGYAILGREEPTLDVGGSGSGLTCDWTFTTIDPTGCIRWVAASAEVTYGGSGYVDNEAATLTAGGLGITVEGGWATLQTGRVAPTATVAVSGTGTGAVLTPAYTKGYSVDSRSAWSVTDVTITDGGTGYTEGDPVSLDISVGMAEPFATEFSGTVQVDGDGVITGVLINHGGSYWADTGVVESVVVDAGGEYYQENTSLAEIVPPITAKIAQLLPSAGSGAAVTAVVDNDQYSEHFGQVTAVNVTTGGSGYIAHELYKSTDCIEWYSERSVVLHKPYETSTCGRTTNGCNWDLSVTLGHDTHGADLNFNSPPPRIYYSSIEPAPDCGSLNNEMQAAGGNTATLTGGGTYSAGTIPTCPQVASFTFRGKTQGGTISGGVYPTDPYVYDGAPDVEALCYTTGDPVYVSCTQALAQTQTSMTLVEMCAAEGSGPVRDCVYSGGGEYTEYNDASCAVIMGFQCPCRYWVGSVAIREEVTSGLDDDGALWAMSRLSTWATREPVQVANNVSAWPGPDAYEWRLLFTTVWFRKYLVGTRYQKIFESASQAFQYGYADSGLPASPDDLPAGTGVWQKGWWDLVSGYAGLSGSIFPSDPPDIDWDIQWGTGNVPS